MDTAVALVTSYLRFNGYISVPEQPILVGEGRPWRYHTATDLDLLAVRFPYAAVVVPRNGGGPPWEDEDLTFGVDPMLDLQEGVVDVLVAEVKEGRPRLNEALRDPIILEAALSRLNAGFDDPMERIVRGLIQRGEAKTEAGGRKWRFRLVAFGDGAPITEGGPFVVIPLRHVALFLMRTMTEHHQVWRDAQFGDPVLDLLHLLEKLGLGLRWVDAQRRAAEAGGRPDGRADDMTRSGAGADPGDGVGEVGGDARASGAGSAPEDGANVARAEASAVERRVDAEG